jgi:hypothetical protein
MKAPAQGAAVERFSGRTGELAGLSDPNFAGKAA